MGPSPLNVHRSSTDVSIDNSAAATDILTYPVEMGHLDLDRGLRVWLYGQFKNESGATRTAVISITYGSTVVYTNTLSMPNETVSPLLAWSMVFDLYAKDSDVLQELAGHFFADTSTPTEWAMYGTAAENGADPLDLVVTVELSTAATTVEFHLRRAVIEQI